MMYWNLEGLKPRYEINVECNSDKNRKSSLFIIENVHNNITRSCVFPDLS